MSSYKFVWYWLWVLVTALAVMRLIWNEFPDLQIEDVLVLVLVLTDQVVEVARYYFEAPIQQFLNWMEQQFGIRLWLQYHWIYAYGLMQLFLLNYSAALGDGAWRWVASVVFALVFGALTGSVHLGHPSVLFYPVSGVFLFAALTLALVGRFAEGGGTALSIGGSALVFAVAFAALDPTSTVEAGLTKSFGFVALIAVSVIAGIILAMGGFTVSQVGNSGDPGRQMGFNVLMVLLTAGTILTLSVLYQLMYPTIPTKPMASGEGFRDCVEAYCPTMKRIPAGAFEMGSDDAELAFAGSLGAAEADTSDEEPKHKVKVRAFSMSITEVTREQFEAFVRERPYKPSGFCSGVDDERKQVSFDPRRRWDNPGFPQQGDHPVVCITWHDAKAYAAFLTRMTGHRYRLPSEAEWEYAARAGTTTSRHWGQSDEHGCEYANVFDASAVAEFKTGQAWAFRCSDDHAFTAPVGKFKPNAFGLYHMLGNASEWTFDCYNKTYEGAPENGSAWEPSEAWVSGSCALRVVRGGSWSNSEWRVRSANRVGANAAGRDNIGGFRVARNE